MSVNSLANFGVPGLNGDRGAVIQPIFQNRFRVLFYDFGTNGEVAPYDLTRQIRSINRPQVTFETQSLYSYVSTVYVVTRAEWNEITVRFFDDIANTVMFRLQMQISKQMNFFDQTFSRAGENYKFEMDIDCLAGGASSGNSTSDPNVIQQWQLAGCMIVNNDAGELTYDSANSMELGVTIRYDNCVLFDQTGVQMGTFSHTAEIAAQQGLLSTGAGIGGGFAASIGGQSVAGGTPVDLTFGGAV